MPNPELKVFSVRYINTQLAQPILPFMELAGSLRCSQLIATVTCPEVVASKP
jgi:hypothetical protein